VLVHLQLSESEVAAGIEAMGLIGAALIASKATVQAARISSPHRRRRRRPPID
jgi:hypothetical protein